MSKQLHNKIDKRILEQQLDQSRLKRITLSFYRYVRIQNPGQFRDDLYQRFDELGILGRVYVATEGVNAQISVPADRFDEFETYISDSEKLSGMRLNIAVEDDGKSFAKLKIKVRHKIVADGLNDNEIDFDNGGKHITALDFNKLTDEQDAIVVDMRNHYESEVGHFKGAITPDVDCFRDSLPMVEELLQDDKEKPIIMYCTGGIRCEKASAYLKNRGFNDVYQLDGGIIKYAHDAERLGIENKFLGKNFVFDRRLGERISDDVISQCHQCGNPSDRHINCRNDACHLLFIQCDECAAKLESCCSKECREVVHMPEEKQRELRKGKNKGRQVFKKGRSDKLAFKR